MGSCKQKTFESAAAATKRTAIYGSLSTAATAARAASAATAAAAAAAAAASAPAAAETAALGALTEAGREVLLQVVLPLLFVWLLQQWLERLEERTIQEMHTAPADAAAAAAASDTDGPAGAAGPKASSSSSSSHHHADTARRASLMRHLFSGLPSAPSRIALIALTVTHVARSLAEINKRLAERGLAEGWLGSPTLANYLLGTGGRGADVVEVMRKAMTSLDHGLLTLYKVLLVGVCTWVVVSWKDVVLSRFLVRRAQRHVGEDLERILTPLNTVATWALVVCAGLLVVSLVGVDVRPLLVLTGGGGVVAGLASQQLLSNAISGLQMYMDRPFRVGDTIAVNAGGSSVEGEVVDLSALRTHVLTGDGCIVAIPNSSLAECVIVNKSQSSRGGVRPPWMETRTPLSVTLRIRLRPATYDRMWSKMDDLKTAIVNTGAVEAVGKSAPILEVQSFTERGVMVQARVTLRNPFTGPAMASSLPAKSAAPAATAGARAPAAAMPPNTATIVVSKDASRPAVDERAGSAAVATAAADGNSTGEQAAANALGDADWVSFTTQDSSASGLAMPSHTAAPSSSSMNGVGPAAAAAASAAAAAAASNNGGHAPPPLQHYPGGLPPSAAPSNYFWPPTSGASGIASVSYPAAGADGGGAAAASSNAVAAAAPAAAAAGAVEPVGSSSGVGGSSGSGSSKASRGSHRSSSSRHQQQQQQQQDAAAAAQQQPQQQEGVSRETVRLMRQQLLLNLGPWLQAHNATLMLGD
ncbi:hypothetical protein HXX76_001573 [Chlamydomonas incerta]|uniref:Mechanosensitive ion channel MscS domain-containing protein n=1 Tax=Chlamydomonas incerta TaxID=51695 RepID=A0A836B1F3_CHLIN|nr:hypothetical protein HXX76_001573 [Chlamydomonas incerta]|eukprot:KAG2444831.1 hypothetical protein HXX76_001573 [Chlamydomonas incerta]